MMVLEINGQRIGRDRLRRETALLRRESTVVGDFEEQMRLAAEAEQIVIDHVLLDQEAVRIGVAVTEQELGERLAALAPRSDGVAGCRAGISDEMRAEVARRLRIDRLLARWMGALHPPGIEELRKYYKRNLEAFHSPEMACVSHIVKNVGEGDDATIAEESLRLVRERLAAGEDFGRLARQHSDCPEQDGDLGWFPRGVMVEEFDAVVFAALVGALTEVFRTRFGWHIAMVRDHKAAGLRSFEEVRPEIELASLRKKQDREVGARLAQLRSRAVIRKVTVAQ